MKRISQLDGLRGVAILLVLAFHLGLLPGGAIGVDIFFVLSGYLITTILLNECGVSGRFSIWNFYTRRAFRILPALAVLLAIYCAVIALQGNPIGRHGQYLAVLSAIAFAMNWAMIAGRNSGLIGNTWTLAVEEQFYIIWPFILSVLILLPRRVMPWAALILILASFLWRSWLIVSGSATTEHIVLGSDTRALQIFMGCFLAMIPIRNFPYWIAKAWPVPSAILAAFVSVKYSDGRIVWDSILVAICAAWIIVAVRENDVALSRILRIDLLIWIGRISYSLYLWHWPIIFVLQKRTSINQWEQDALAVPLSFGAAALSYYWIEKPALRIGHQLFPSRTSLTVAAPLRPIQLAE